VRPEAIGSSGFAVSVGLLSSGLLVSFYLSVATLSSGSLEHAMDLLALDSYYISAAATGVGVQMGLFAYLRRLTRSQPAVHCSTAVAAGGAGSSGATMVSCCLHHLADIAPSTSLIFASTFVTKYRLELMAIGLAGNAVGIGLMALMIRRARTSRRISPT